MPEQNEIVTSGSIIARSAKLRFASNEEIARNWLLSRPRNGLARWAVQD